MPTVVIVEDEPVEAESLHRIIAASLDKAQIYEASTGRKAIQLIDQLNHIDLLFVDLNIPRPDGREVIRYLRSKNSEARVIVTSANDDFDMVRSMLHLQVEDYLLKPIKKGTIIDKLHPAPSADRAAVAEASALRQQINTLLAACDYAQWHDFLLGFLAQVSDSQAILLLTLLQQQPALRQASREKLSALALQITHFGFTTALYWRLLQATLYASQEIFDAAQKNCPMDFIARAKFHIERNITGNVTLDAIASKAFVSACYLSRMFKKSVGTGFASYITSRKIRFACALLRFSDLNINALALELSWQDANYFCRIFKKETGLSPSDYRRLQAAPQTRA
ncbi:response regulator [Kalamiella sp. sgz302252]|uniref:response regulator n=1 Tax=Pantoea sp. sgz302252 TaxID=3341827 RepID=UPI0036D23EAF